MLEKNRTQRGEEPAPSIEMYRNVADAIGVDVDELVRMVDGKVLLSQKLPSNCLPLPRTVKKPRLGAIACGKPILAVENISEYDDVPITIHCDFTLLCKGDSMIDARIWDGDVVYIRQQPEVENGEIAAALLSDTFAYAMVKDGKLKCIRSQQDTDFADRTCCVLAMNGQFVRENPTIAKKVAQAVQKAHSWMRDNSAEATQVLMDMGWNGGNYEMNIMINNALQFGLSDEFTGATLKDFIERYVRLGLITSMDDTDEILNLAWTPIL